MGAYSRLGTNSRLGAHSNKYSIRHTASIQVYVVGSFVS